ncbi:hypothetical protein E3P92_03307 [Wallemia ichthyophaga]|nr:hypothetical protein E3P95_00150 [Wallemia ichthyophaga]TIB06073.1 hypothetical protein E3P94_00150 [Wallemia ichthyophaga]TIB10022.1 hypothetical protein E3P92_03307 [Wallemia ichthyophaga]
MSTSQPKPKRLVQPARRQVEPGQLKKPEIAQTGFTYNIWYNKWAGGDYEDSTNTKEHAQTRLDVPKDSGYTRADASGAKTYCLFFARGCCPLGAQCQYLHRLPRPQNILHDLSRDVFGREKHANYRDDMSGVGSFSRQNSTLYIGRMAEYGEGRGENQLIKHFGEFGEIEKVRVLHGRGCGFVKFKNECNAQFAKEAMGSQSLDEGETLNVRWATEDPKADAIEEDRKRAAEEGSEKVTKRLAMDTELIHATRQMEALQNGLPAPPPLEQIADGEGSEVEGEEDASGNDAISHPPQQPTNQGLLSNTSLQAINKLAQLRATKPTAVAVAQPPSGGLSGHVLDYQSQIDDESGGILRGWPALTLCLSNVFQLAFYGVHLGLFVYGWWSQQTNERLAGLNKLGISVWASRGAGLVLALDGGLILLPMLKNLIHVIRSCFGSVIPLDEPVQLAMFIMFTTAHASIRHQKFELFWYTHQVCALVFMLALFTHATGCFWPFIAYIFERLFREARARFLKTYITEVLVHPGNTIEIRFAKPSLKYKSGQYIWIQVPEISKFQWHPFTITSAPEDEFISVHVRQVGDFSKSLGALFGVAMNSGTGKQDDLSSDYVSQVICNCKMPKFLVDGPYGAPADHALKQEVVVLVGAGIGVTPFASILKSLWYRNANDQLGTLKRVEFYWICRETESLIWFKKLLIAIEEGQQMHSSFISINIYLTRWEDDMIHNITLNDVGAKADPLTSLRARTRFGRPDWRHIYSELKRSITQADSTYIHGREARLKTNIATFFCGPGPLGKSLQEAIKSVGKDEEVEFRVLTRQQASMFKKAGPAENSSGVPTFMGLTGNKLVAAITTTATTGFLLFGYDQGVMSGIISAKQFAEVFPRVSQDWQLENGYQGDPQGADEQASIIQATYTSIYEIGCLMGAASALFLGDKLGRCKMMGIGALIMVLGTIIQVTCYEGSTPEAQFCVGRVVTGIGNGINTATIPSWQAETSKSHNRGLLVCIEGSMIATGTVIAYWIDFGLSFVDGDVMDVSWRFPIAFQIVFAFGLFAGAFFLPDSPRWLLVNGYEEQGARVVASLNNVPMTDKIAIQEIQIIKDSVKAMSAIKAKKTDVFTGGKTQHFRRVWLGANSQFFQQIGGCNAVIYFSPVIFEDRLSLDRNLALILGGVNVTVYALCAYSSYWLVEHVGRRKMFLWGSVGQGLSMLLIMACMIPQYRVNEGLSYSGKDPQEVIKGSVVGMFLFLGFFGATWLELPWLYPAEINPLRIRTNANAISTMSNWSWNFAVVQWTPPMLASIDFGTFAFFGAICLLFVPVIYFFYPETAGRSLEEIDIIFAIGYTEGRTYWKVAEEMPKLSQDEIKSELDRFGLSGIDADIEKRQHQDSPDGSSQDGAAMKA